MADREKPKDAGSTGFPACAAKDEVIIRSRNLPHWQLPGSTYFITFKLRAGIMSEDERSIVLNSIKHFHRIRYWVTVAVVMPDHAHIILKPMLSESEIDFPLSIILQVIVPEKSTKIGAQKVSYGMKKVLIALSGIMMTI